MAIRRLDREEMGRVNGNGEIMRKSQTQLTAFVESVAKILTYHFEEIILDQNRSRGTLSTGVSLTHGNVQKRNMNVTARSDKLMSMKLQSSLWSISNRYKKSSMQQEKLLEKLKLD